MIRAARQCSGAGDELFIFDARSNLAAGGNMLMGKGTESVEVYEQAKIRFLDIANIHVVRASFDALRVRTRSAVLRHHAEQEVCETGSENRWWSMVEGTGWLGHIRSVMLGL